MRKNSYDKILRGKLIELYLNTVLKSCILYILVYNLCNVWDSLIFIHGRICKSNNNKIFKFYC